MEEIRVQLDSLIFIFKKYKCQGFASSNAPKEEKNVRQVGWVGRDDVDFNHVFSDY